MLIALSSCGLAQVPLLQTSDLRVGDIIFQELACGDFCEAIEKVTSSWANYRFSHCGMVVNDSSGGLVVIEAASAGVVLTPIAAFLAKSANSAVVGRLHSQQDVQLIPKASQVARSLLGSAYDHAFDLRNDKYYCSELIYHAFWVANAKEPLFQLAPMTFKDPDSGEFFPPWVTYYEQLNLPIPEGKPGLNPGSLSLDEKLNKYRLVIEE